MANVYRPVAEDTGEVTSTPERRLIACMLMRAYADIKKVPPNKLLIGRNALDKRGNRLSDDWPEFTIEHYAEQATLWVLDKSPQPWGYKWACRVLNVPMLTIEQIYGLNLTSQGKHDL